MNDDTALVGTWDIDPLHSRFGFSTRHAMISKVRGAFNDVSGRAVFPAAGTELASVTVSAQMDSIDTRSVDRDAHLRSVDFFDVENYPTMDFVSTQVQEVDDAAFIVTGDLTIHGITRSLSIPLAMTGINTDPFGNLRAGFEGTCRIDRRNWSVSWNTPLDNGGLLVSDKITLEFELSLIRASEETDVDASEDSSDEDTAENPTVPEDGPFEES